MTINLFEEEIFEWYAETKPIPTKRCPKCTEVFDLTTDHWYTRPIRGRVRASAYCKKCMNKTNSDRQRDRRMGIPAKRSRCSVCNLVSNKVVWQHGNAVCGWCAEIVEWYDWEIPRLMRDMAKVTAHNKEEDRLDSIWRANKRRRPHSQLKAMGPQPPQPEHVKCIRMEASMRGCLRMFTMPRSPNVEPPG